MNEQKNVPHHILNNGYTDLSTCYGRVECSDCGQLLDPYGQWQGLEYECPVCGENMSGVSFTPYADDETGEYPDKAY